MFQSRHWWRNYLAIALSVLLVLALPIMIIGIGQVQRLTNRASSLELTAQTGLSRVVVRPPDSIEINEATQLTVTVPQTLTYNAVTISVDPHYIDNVSLQAGGGWKWQHTYSSSSKVSYVWATTPLQVNGTDVTDPKQANPINCFPQICPGERQIAPAKTDLKVTITFTVSSPFAATQRPIMVTGYGLLTSGNKALYDVTDVRPELPLASYLANTEPQINSLPKRLTSPGEPYQYVIDASDADTDSSLFFTTSCPDFLNCDPTLDQPASAGWQVQGKELSWTSPMQRSTPYLVNVYVTDGKSVAQQTYSLAVADPSNALPPTCQKFTTAFPLALLSDSEPTNMILVAEDLQGLSDVQVDFTNTSTSSSPEQTLRWHYPDSPSSVVLDRNSQPALRYQFKTGQYQVTATLTNQDGKTTTCPLQLANPETAPTVSLGGHWWQRFTQWLVSPALAQSNGIAAGSNVAPQFTTDPYKDSNVNLQINEEYKYTLKVTDSNSDNLSYVTVTKPSWSKVSTKQSPGSLELTITGTPTKNGSNTFSFSVTDGYASHYVTQTWLVNVEDPNNDIPQITITKPSSAASLEQGQSLNISWDAQDKQQLIRFDLYVTTDPDSTKNSALSLTNLSYKTRSASLKTTSLAPGKYYVVVTGTDTFKPPATGKGISPLITITGGKDNGNGGGETGTPSTEVPYPNPVVTNVNPADQSTVKTRSPVISATVKSSTGATLAGKQIAITVDDKDVTSLSKVTGDGATEGTVVYTPPTLLDNGKHSVTITVKDSSGKETTFTWSFTVNDATSTQTPSETPSTTDDTEVINLWGYRIPKQIAIFLGLGLLILIIALLLPLLLFIAWRKNDRPQSSKDRTKPPQDLPPTSSSTTTTETRDLFATSAPVVVAPVVDSSPAYGEEPTSSNPPYVNAPYVVPQSNEPAEFTTTVTEVPESLPSEPPVEPVTPQVTEPAASYVQITGEEPATASTPTPAAADSEMNTSLSKPLLSEETEQPAADPTAPTVITSAGTAATALPSEPATAYEPPVVSSSSSGPAATTEPTSGPTIQNEPAGTPAATPEEPQPNHPNVPHLLNPAEELSPPEPPSQPSSGV